MAPPPTRLPPPETRDSHHPLHSITHLQPITSLATLALNSDFVLITASLVTSMALCTCTEPAFHLHYRNNHLTGLPDCSLAHLLWHRPRDPSKIQISPLPSSQPTSSLPPQFSLPLREHLMLLPMCSLWAALSPCCFFWFLFVCLFGFFMPILMALHRLHAVFHRLPLLTHPLCPYSPSAVLSFGLYEPMHFWSKLVHFEIPCNQKSLCAPAHLVRVPASALLQCFALEFNSLSPPCELLESKDLVLFIPTFLNATQDPAENRCLVNVS